MRKLFWVFFFVALLEGAYLIYHFATFEHSTTPLQPTLDAFPESLRVYQGRLAELERYAEQTRNKLDQVGKSEWPSVHLRLETADREIAHLRDLVKRWEEAPSKSGVGELYHEATAVYGRAAGMVLSSTYDTLLEPEGTTVPREKLPGSKQR